jgi:hypothetical protein
MSSRKRRSPKVLSVDTLQVALAAAAAFAYLAGAIVDALHR